MSNLMFVSLWRSAVIPNNLAMIIIASPQTNPSIHIVHLPEKSS